MSWKGHRLSFLRGLRISVLLSIVIVAAVLTLSALTAHAREDVVPGSRYVPADAAAMGDAYLPLAIDPASALFYNPAGLGRVRGFKVAAFNLEAYGNSNYFSSLDASHPDFYKITSLSGYLPSLERHPATPQGAGFSFLPSFYWKGFAFGMLAQSQVSATYNTNGTVNYRSLYQLIPTAGTAIRMADGIVRLGYSIQWVNEAVGSASQVPTSTVPLGYNQGLAQGTGFSSTLGFALTMPYQYLPEFDIVARNLFNTRYRSGGMMPFAKNPSGTPATEQMTIDASVSEIQKLGAGNNLTYVFEDRDATDRSGIALQGRMAIGLQFDIRQWFYLRAGWGDGYPDLGLAIKGSKTEFSLSWYSEEIGNGYHDVQDKRYVFQIQVRAF